MLYRNSCNRKWLDPSKPVLPEAPLRLTSSAGGGAPAGRAPSRCGPGAEAEAPPAPWPLAEAAAGNPPEPPAASQAGASRARRAFSACRRLARSSAMASWRWAFSFRRKEVRARISWWCETRERVFIFFSCELGTQSYVIAVTGRPTVSYDSPAETDGAGY